LEVALLSVVCHASCRLPSVSCRLPSVSRKLYICAKVTSCARAALPVRGPRGEVPTGSKPLAHGQDTHTHTHTWWQEASVLRKHTAMVAGAMTAFGWVTSPDPRQYIGDMLNAVPVYGRQVSSSVPLRMWLHLHLHVCVFVLCACVWLCRVGRWVRVDVVVLVVVLMWLDW